ncbi:hypothetical protein AMELA_G00200910 [Ameiurus melas]|uniref:Uncharacterized protein n=1 Tax=Ameiurus melas TaxID=219545 RepID=A0A7J6A748_AMEME|nr:hypothetical protein AMELA_G00200910 [Ameiurus melas]
MLSERTRVWRRNKYTPRSHAQPGECLADKRPCWDQKTSLACARVHNVGRTAEVARRRIGKFSHGYKCRGARDVEQPSGTAFKLRMPSGRCHLLVMPLLRVAILLARSQINESGHEPG